MVRGVLSTHPSGLSGDRPRRPVVGRAAWSVCGIPAGSIWRAWRGPPEPATVQSKQSACVLFKHADPEPPAASPAPGVGRNPRTLPNSGPGKTNARGLEHRGRARRRQP